MYESSGMWNKGEQKEVIITPTDMGRVSVRGLAKQKVYLRGMKRIQLDLKSSLGGNVLGVPVIFYETIVIPLWFFGLYRYFWQMNLIS